VRTVAALFVAKRGPYIGLEGVDPWDIDRDARTYAGPHPIVAHPPCSRWCRLAGLVEHRWGHAVGDDGGCFEAALLAVRTWGGVLEHPAWTLAWPAFDLPAPALGGWQQSLLDGSWVCEVAQSAYGHRATKATWLYYVGDRPPPALDWSRPKGAMAVGYASRRGDGSWFRCNQKRMPKREASRTPLPFRDLLIRIARGARAQEAA